MTTANPHDMNSNSAKQTGQDQRSEQGLEKEQPKASHPNTHTDGNAASYLKLVCSAVLLFSSIRTYQSHHAASYFDGDNGLGSAGARRRLSASYSADAPPSYMKDLMKDLKERQKLFDETPPEEVKYWFEYTGPLQVRIL